MDQAPSRRTGIPECVAVRRQIPAPALPNTPFVPLALDPAVISPGLAQDGQGANPDPGQVRSLTSRNNFINFCLTQNTELTNGKQVVGGSCNPTPMGRIISFDVAPSSKFVFPKNTDSTLQPNQAFTIQMKVRNMVLGNFVNAQRCATRSRSKLTFLPIVYQQLLRCSSASQWPRRCHWAHSRCNRDASRIRFH